LRVGEAKAKLDEPETAILHLERASALFDEVGDRRSRAEAFLVLGRTRESSGEWNRAVGDLSRALELLREGGRTSELAAALLETATMLAAHATSLDEAHVAADHFRDALRQFESARRPRDLEKAARHFHEFAESWRARGIGQDVLADAHAALVRPTEF
jgi:hypothetical protein